jgi:hypothetical protein
MKNKKYFEIEMGDGEVICVEKIEGLTVAQTGEVFIEMVRSKAQGVSDDVIKSRQVELYQKFRYINSIKLNPGETLFLSRRQMLDVLKLKSDISEIEADKSLSELQRRGMIVVVELKYGVLKMSIPHWEEAKASGIFDLMNSLGQDNFMSVIKAPMNENS